MQRRQLVTAAAALPFAASAAATAADCSDIPGLPFTRLCTPWPQGLEGQRRADLGNGHFRNPVLAGDRPDPTVLRVGDNFYATHSSFDALPGLLIWHSRDLVNWRPLVNALHVPVGSVWAPELTQHGGRFYLYVPVKAPPGGTHDIVVLHAERIEGPWSAPISLGLPKHIDPGHIVGEDGERYLFLSGGDRVRLSADGLRTVGPVEHVFDGWRYPEDWVVESYSQEGPKLLRHGGWFHMVLAIGGTAGPPTGHMVVAARSRSIHGPWEHAPHNPLLRTTSPQQRWWSRGHGTLVRGPQNDWWMAYHGYEAGFHTRGAWAAEIQARAGASCGARQGADEALDRPQQRVGNAVWPRKSPRPFGLTPQRGRFGVAPLARGPTPGGALRLASPPLRGQRGLGFLPPRLLGRQMLLAPARYSDDGWFHIDADDATDLPLPAPGRAVPHGMALSDDFQAPTLAPQWAFLAGGPGALGRVQVGGGALRLSATGDGPGTSPPLGFVQGDAAFEITVDADFDEGVQIGLLMFYSPRLYAGMGVNARQLKLHRYGLDQRNVAKPAGLGRSLQMRLRCERHVLSLATRPDATQPWTPFPVRMDVSGYHHNTAGGFMSLRPALYASGQGTARFRALRYQALT